MVGRNADICYSSTCRARSSAARGFPRDHLGPDAQPRLRGGPSDSVRPLQCNAQPFKL